MQHGRRVAGGARLLAGQAELADLHRMGRIAQIVDHGHAVDPPAMDARHQIGDAGVALPPVLMGAVQPHDLAQLDRPGRLADVPHLMAGIAEGT